MILWECGLSCYPVTIPLQGCGDCDLRSGFSQGGRGEDLSVQSSVSARDRLREALRGRLDIVKSNQGFYRRRYQCARAKAVIIGAGGERSGLLGLALRLGRETDLFDGQSIKLKVRLSPMDRS